MLNIIKRVLAFLLPILGKAALQTASDVLADVAYPDRRTSRRTSYSQPPRGYTDTVDLDATVDEPQLFGESHQGNEYHDVLMMAFDISGPNMHVVKEFLYNYMPVTGEQVFNGERIYLDSYWIADDDAGDSDCMSAVFVHKGDQESARGFLRRGGLA